MQLFHNKKGQWVRAQLREQRSSERGERVIQTYILQKHNCSIEDITLELGVSPNTIRSYIKEIKSNPQYFETIYQKRLKIAKELEKKRIRKLTRTNKEIYIEEISNALGKSILYTGIALLWWWIPSIVIYVSTEGSRGNAFDVTGWIYSVNGFIRTTIILAIVISIIKISDAIDKRNEYLQEKKKK